MKRIFALILLVRYSGLRHILRILRYSWWKSRLDRQYWRARRTPRIAPGKSSDGMALAADIAPGWLLSVQQLDHGAEFKFEQARLEVTYLAPDLARLTWEPGELPLPYALARQDWSGAPVSLEEVDTGWRLVSADLQIQVSRDGLVSYYNAQGQTLRRDLAPQRQGQSWTHRPQMAPGEHILGLGELSAGLDRRGGQYCLWNTDPGGSYGPGKDPLYMPLPVTLGLHTDGCSLVFFENYSPAWFDLPGHEDLRGTGTARFESGALRLYFISGSPARLLECFTELTGRSPLPPRWALGYHQSRWGYQNTNDVLEVAAGFREHRLPISAIHLDIDYMRGFRIFSMDQERFPDLAGLSRELAAQGVRLVTIIDPGVKQDPGYDIYQQGLKEGLFCTLPDGNVARALVWPGWSVFPDFTDPRARRWWGGLYARLLEAGVSGFWHDMNEPATFAAWGGSTLPDAVRHNLEGRGVDHRLGHNLYGLLMNRAAREALVRLQPDRRPWILSRSGWVGGQRYAWNWTGDTESSWPALRMAVAQTLSLGLSGQPYSGPDIGGFSGAPDAELYVRAFQMAAFLPFFRTHSAIGTPRREPWVYGKETTEIVRRFLELRYSLLPYLYTLAWECARTGAPLARPLWWGQEADTRLWGVEDAFLLGDALLAAPVVEAGARRRELPLPAGVWYSFWGDMCFAGQETITLDAPLERMPLLVRAGSVLPRETNRGLELHIYAQSAGFPDCQSSLYSDSGDGPILSNQDWRCDHFNVHHSDGLYLEWQTEGDYPFPYPEVTLHLHGFTPRRAFIDGRLTPVDSRIFTLRPFQEVHFWE